MTRPPMPESPQKPNGRLRAKAEAQLRPTPEITHPDTLPPERIRELVHELAVHQIELELQNEELQRTQQEVEAARARYRDLYDLAPVGYFILDPAWAIVEANLEAASLVGIPREGLVGRSFTHFVLFDQQDTLYLHRKALAETGEVQSFALRMRGGEAGPTWVWVTAAAMHTRPGEAPPTLVVLNDISRRKAAEAEQVALRAQLAEAERLEALGTLAGGVAHDFNNLLAGILGWLSVLELEGEAPETFPDDVAEVKALVERGAELTRQLLGFARRGRYDVRPLDLAAVVEKTGAMFGRTRPDLAFETGMPSGLPAVLMDHAQLEQVLLNLFVNAGQAMPEGGELTVVAAPRTVDGPMAARRGVHPGTYVELDVSDTGSGMDAATQARIFEPFFTTKGLGKGTGLGLASAHGILKAHGGDIQVESAPGKGTTFTLLLPTTEASPSGARGGAPSVTPAKGTVLVVDDEPTVRRMQGRLVESLGYTVLRAASGAEAVEVLRDHLGGVDLVLLDMTMPGMSGAETFDALRAIDPKLPVLLASGYGAAGKAQEILDRGCNGFIQKPFDLAALNAKLREIL